MPSLDDLVNLLAIGAQADLKDGTDTTTDIDIPPLGPIDAPNPLSIVSPLLPTARPGTQSISGSATVSATNSAAQSSSSASSNASATGSSSASAAASSNSSSSTSASVSATTSASASATDSAARADSSSTPAPDASSTLGGSVPTAATDSAASSTPTLVSNIADNAPKGFLANKPLSISVIVVASLLGLIFFVLIGTWAVRRRRRGKISKLADELSSDSLAGSGSSFGSGGSSFSHGSSDVEKGVAGTGGWGVDVIDKMEAVGGARSEGTAFGAGAAAAATASAASSSRMQRNVPPAAYGQPAYAPRSVSPQETYGQAPYAQLPARTASRRAAPSSKNAMYYQQPMAAQLYSEPATTYAAPYAAAQPSQQQHLAPSPVNTSPTESFQYGSHLPNPFEGAELQLALPAPYDLARTPIPAQQFSVGPRHPAIQRKPPPPYLTLDTAMSPVAGPVSAGSLNGAPMQPAASINTASPSMAVVESPQELAAAPKLKTPTRSSLLDGPAPPKTPTSASSKRHSKKASVDRRASVHETSSSVPLHPGPPPVAPPLPEEFGNTPAGEQVSPDPSTRVLKVVNA